MLDMLCYNHICAMQWLEANNEEYRKHENSSRALKAKKLPSLADIHERKERETALKTHREAKSKMINIFVRTGLPVGVYPKDEWCPMCGGALRRKKIRRDSRRVKELINQ